MRTPQVGWFPDAGTAGFSPVSKTKFSKMITVKNNKLKTGELDNYFYRL
jgi:hypothetical protein